MKFELTILGCNSAIPAYNRFPTSQVLRVGHRLYLIDCGEGAQIRMGELAVRKNKINQIFISHLHGDHIFGLIGLLTSYSLGGREKPMDIFSPKGLKELIEVQIKYSESHLSYPLRFHEVDTNISKLIFEDGFIEVVSIPLIHRIPTTGYLFREKKPLLNIRPKQIKKYKLTVEQIVEIKNGADFINPEGVTIPNRELVLPPLLPRAYAYCSDTQYNESIIPIIRHADLLYHETTFLQDKLEQAKMTMHSTTVDAATIAKAAEVGQLITGHYSSRYEDLTMFEKETQAIFANTVIGMDGAKYEVLQKRGSAHT